VKKDKRALRVHRVLMVRREKEVPTVLVFKVQQAHKVPRVLREKQEI